MKRKKFALMLAMSLTFTSFSGAGWSVYADELPEIVEDEAEAPEVYSEDGDGNGAGIKIQDYTEEVYVCPDEDVTLSGTATCTHGTLSYQSYEVDEDGYVIGEIISREAMCGVPTKTAFYECKVSNGYWEDEVKCSVGVDSGFAINGEQKTITVHASEYATLSVNVVTDYPDALTYQWEQWDENEYEWKKIEGAISSKYQTGAMETGESYRCFVSDGYNQGWAYRNVKVDRGFVVEEKEKWIDADSDGTAVLSVSASTREGTLTYQWYDIYGDKIEGATSSKLILKNITEDQTYSCIVSNGYEEEMVYRTVYKKQEVVVEGGGIRYIYPGKSTNLYVKVSYVKGDLSYKWYKGNIWDENPELIGSERTLTVAEEGYYYCVVSNGKSDDYVSYDVRLDDGFELISKGGIIEVSAGKTIILNAEAKIVVGDLIYQWYKNGVALEEENTPFLETSVVPQEGVDKYTCIVTNDASGWGDKKEVSYWVCADAKKWKMIYP